MVSKQQQKVRLLCALPDECWLKVFGFLEAAELSGAASTLCAGAQELANEPHLWVELLYGDFCASFAQRALLRTWLAMHQHFHPRQLYVYKRREHRLDLDIARTELHQRGEQAREQDRKQRRLKWLNFVLVRVTHLLLCICLLASSVLLWLRLDRVIDWTFYYILLPMFVFEGFVLLSSLVAFTIYFLRSSNGWTFYWNRLRGAIRWLILYTSPWEGAAVLLLASRRKLILSNLCRADEGPQYDLLAAEGAAEDTDAESASVAESKFSRARALRASSVVSFDVREDEHCGSCKSCRQCCRKFIDSPSFIAVMTLSLVFALYGHSIWNVAGVPDDPGNLYLDVGMTIVAVLFTLEILLNAIADRDYVWSMFFWMDVVGTASMAFEVSYLYGPQGSFRGVEGVAGGSANGNLVRAARASKLGARAARFVKIVKVTAWVAAGKNKIQRETDAAEKSLATRQFVQAMSERVSLLTVILVMVLPILSFGQFPVDDYSMSSWLKRLQADYEKDYFDAVHHDDTALRNVKRGVKELKDFYHDMRYFPYEIHGFDSVAADHDQRLSVPGEYLLFGSEPVRKEYIEEVTMSWDACFSAEQACEGTSLTMLFNFEAMTKLEDAENMATISFVLFIMFVFAFDLSRTLQFMLGMEKMSKVGDILRRKMPVIDDMTHETKGVQHLISEAGLQENASYSVRKTVAFRDSFSTSSSTTFEAGLIDSWTMDMLDCDAHRRKSAVFYMMFHSQFGQDVGRGSIDVDSFLRFYDRVLEGYNEVPYHNFQHAVDVCYFVYNVMRELQCSMWVDRIEQYALFVASLCHDIGHEGKTNQFLVETGHTLALRYNDKSPLENMHCATLFEICGSSRTDMFKFCERDAYLAARKVCVEAILHTDNVKHFDMVKEISVIFEMSKAVCNRQATQDELTQEYVELLRKNRLTFLSLFLHLADVSNPLKPFEQGKVWATRIVEEFFLQGDEEKRLGLPVGMLNDRDKVTLHGAQHGFVSFLVAPLVTVTISVFPHLDDFGRLMVSNLFLWRDVWISVDNPPPNEVSARDATLEKLKASIDDLFSRR